MTRTRRVTCLSFIIITCAILTCLIILHVEDSVYTWNIWKYMKNETENSTAILPYILSSPMRAPPLLLTTRISMATVRQPSKNVSAIRICKFPDKYVYKITVNVTASEVLNSTAIELVQPSGRFEPKTCKPRANVAIIIPYRNRSQHREILLNHLHNFLQRQMVKYDIYLVEPVLPLIFNRGLLSNIGFTEAMAKNRNYTCIIIHDVDQLPLNSENHYTCDINARHLATESSKNKYKIPYDAYIGGVVAIQPSFYSQLNGFSNVFFGWGGEDDDLLMRIQILNKKQGIPRPAKGVGRYIALPHDRDNLNSENPNKFKLYKTSKTRFRQEGLNTLKYELLSTRTEPLYTLIQVSYNVSQVMQEFEDKWGAKKGEVDSKGNTTNIPDD